MEEGREDLYGVKKSHDGQFLVVNNWLMSLQNAQILKSLVFGASKDGS